MSKNTYQRDEQLVAAITRVIVWTIVGVALAGTTGMCFWVLWLVTVAVTK